MDYFQLVDKYIKIFPAFQIPVQAFLQPVLCFQYRTSAVKTKIDAIFYKIPPVSLGKY